jgi:RNA polymerase sigma-70 factor, ECF subfamily
VANEQVFPLDSGMTTTESADDLRPLIRRCLTGDQGAMLTLVERFRGQVFGLCYRMLGHRQDAEDVAQETFVRVLKNLHRWDAARDFEPWLFAIAGNRCRTALSTRKSRPPAETLPEQISDGLPDMQAAKNLAEEVTLALAGIREDYRQAFVLFHEHELSYGEIAEAMSVPLGTVKTWVHRARRVLIDELQRRGVVGERVSTAGEQQHVEGQQHAVS